ncbi:MAG: hypothetical protein COV36_01290 [Alphaproteobacteria bacterium CG11_big_fil_rev_8_21_14_0_20_44_7]|nr:MAG: hypothetical protein COV36_01290 [Alphaproteobacteria bacterium CG11_big_fil_rev_8_21_14_0_20_44_7]
MVKQQASKQIEKGVDFFSKTHLRMGLFIFVLVPTFLAAFYYLLVASDIYISETKFSVNVEGQNSQASIGQTLIPTMGPALNIQEAMVVKEFLRSRGVLDALEGNIDLKTIYSSKKADPLSSISRSADKEDFLEYFREIVDVQLDDVSGITTLRVRAFAPDDALLVASSMVDQAEEFVNKMSRRVQEDAISFSHRELENSEKQVIASNDKLTEFRNKNKNFDPTLTAEGVLKIIGSLESELASTEAEIAEMKNYMHPGSPQILSLEAKARSLRQQIGSQTGRLASEEGAPLAQIAQEYEALSTQKDFAIKRYELSLSSLEAAQVDARKKSKYLLRIVEPTKPESAEEPKRFKEILTVFFTCLIAYSIFGLIVAAIKDHVRP